MRGTTHERWEERQRLTRPGDGEALLALRGNELGALALARAYGGEPDHYRADSPAYGRLRRLSRELALPFEELVAAVRYRLGEVVPALPPEQGGLPVDTPIAARLGRQLGNLAGVVEHPPLMGQLRCLAHHSGRTPEALMAETCRGETLDAFISGYHGAMDLRQPLRAREARPSLRRDLRRALCGLRVEARIGPVQARKLGAAHCESLVVVDGEVLGRLGALLAEREEPVRSHTELQALVRAAVGEEEAGAEPLDRRRDGLVARLAAASAALGEELVESVCAGPCARGGGLRLLALVPLGCRGCLGLGDADDPLVEVCRTCGDGATVTLRWRPAGPAP
ncbi:MAG: hypothetical protein ABIO70_02440 [Pseudomonadota bacterium]